ncbi:MAG: hypothetical protein IJ262_02230 [Clostridia bacterium]|nr:hypothetical protein [Clostridia bacterium]
MNIFQVLKCVLTLGKCSKWLYFIKKALCVLTIAFLVISFCFFALGENKMCKKVLKQLKAVL